MVAPHLATPTPEILHPLGDFAPAPVRVVDYEVTDPNRSAGMAKHSTPASSELTAELDGATEWLGLAPDVILLAALSRTIARALGDGVVPVDIASERGCMLDAVPLTCVTARQVGPTEVLAGVHSALKSATESVTAARSEVYFNYIGGVGDETEPVQQTPAGLGHALEVRVYRAGGDVHVDWWYDTAGFETYTIEELSEQFPHALYEMTSDALPPF